NQGLSHQNQLKQLHLETKQKLDQQNAVIQQKNLTIANQQDQLEKITQEMKKLKMDHEQAMNQKDQQMLAQVNVLKQENDKLRKQILEDKDRIEKLQAALQSPMRFDRM